MYLKMPYIEKIECHTTCTSMDVHMDADAKTLESVTHAGQLHSASPEAWVSEVSYTSTAVDRSRSIFHTRVRCTRT